MPTNIGTKGRFTIDLDFTEDTLNADMVTTSLDGTGTNAIAANTPGGVVTLLTGTGDDEMNELAISQGVRAMDGPVIAEWKFTIPTITLVAVCVGLTDDADEGGNTLPVELAGTTFTSTASTFVGVVFDVDADNDKFHVFAVDDDADTSTAIATLNTGVAPTAAGVVIVRVELVDRGSSDGMATAIVTVITEAGPKKQLRIDRAVDRDALLFAHIGVENRSAAARSVNLDRVCLEASRP